MRTGGLSWREKISYGLGDFASHMSWDMIAGFLLFFYTDVAGIAVVATGTLMLVSQVLDATIDPVVGAMVDRTRSRHGKARPYLLYGAVPIAVLLFALFLSPFHSETGKLIYAYVTLNLIGIAFSLVNVPYSALMPLMTRDPREKMQLSSTRTIGSAVGTFLVTSAALPLARYFGPDLGRGFAVTAALFGLTATILFLLVFFNCKERFEEHVPAKAHTLGSSIKNMLHNGPWLVTLISGTMILMRLGASIAITVYFAMHVLHNPWMVSVLLPVISIGFTVAAMAAPSYFGWLGIRWGCILALAVGAVFYCLMPVFEAKMWAFLTAYVLSSIAVGFLPTATYAMAGNAVDYQQWRFGTRDDGLIFSSISLATKVGMASGAALIAFALAAAHFDPKAVTPEVEGSIRGLYYGVPPVLMLLQMIPLLFYKLDKLHPEIVRDLACRSQMDVDASALGEAGEGN